MNTPLLASPVVANGGLEQRVRARLERRLFELGWNPARLSQQAGMAPSQLSRYLSGENRIGITNLERLAMAMDTPVAYFVREEEGDIDESRPILVQSTLKKLRQNLQEGIEAIDSLMEAYESSRTEDRLKRLQALAEQFDREPIGGNGEPTDPADRGEDA